MHLPVLGELVIVLAASIAILFACHRLRIPPVTGFLLTGVVIGPSGLGLIRNARNIDVLAEVGVVMLLFTIGLEFSWARLKQIKRVFLLGGSLQIALTTIVFAAAVGALRRSAAEGIFFGFLVSLSSTAVVLKIQADSNESASPQGKVCLGILLFQDLALAPMIALVPILADLSYGFPLKPLLNFFLFVLAVAAVFGLAHFALPKLLHLIVKTRVRELFLITAIFACLGMAYLTFSFGLSLALGAFLAGVILSESEYSRQIVSEVLPFKDLFNSVFFISIGMLLNLGAAWDNRTLTALLALSIFAVKAAVVFAAARALRFNSRVALIAGLSLAQIGEFSFVLAGIGKANDLIGEPLFQAFLASSVLTLVATPFLIQLSPRIAERSGKLLGWAFKPMGIDEAAVKRLSGHVVIAGFGLNGQNLARVLKAAGIGYVVLELDPEAIREAMAKGEPVIFGDVSGPEILKEAGVGKAKAIVFAISDPAATRRGVRLARQANPEVFIIARTRYAAEIDELYRLGASAVIPEEFETSIEIYTRVLEIFHVPANVIDAQTRLLRGERYGILRGAAEPGAISGKLAEILAAGTVETFLVGRGSPADGKTLRSLNLRRETGATVIAVVRGEKTFKSPSAELKIADGDTLVLVASHADMDRAFRFLS
jgi:CPA2 family monovalent cation:H+ antiporter-2